jgi:hypothetical protein
MTTPIRKSPVKYVAMCSIGGCGRIAHTKGLCAAHYTRSRKGLPVEVQLRASRRRPGEAPDPCSVTECERPARTRGYCVGHYGRLVRGQKMDGPFRVTAPRGSASKRDNLGRKCCRICQRWLPTSEFAKHPRTADSLRAHCRDCGKGLQRAYKYGVSEERFRELFDRQGHVCAICHAENPGRWWCIDHDHSCCPGTVTCGSCIRGVICDSCNVGIARFNDSPDSLRRAADYLESTARR